MSELGGDIFMAKKGQQFQKYTEEFKLAALKRFQTKFKQRAPIEYRHALAA
jgi:hypothetical protein